LSIIEVNTEQFAGVLAQCFHFVALYSLIYSTNTILYPEIKEDTTISSDSMLQAIV